MKNTLPQNLKSLPSSNLNLLRPESDNDDNDRRIGAILVERGQLSLDQAASILEAQRSRRERFGTLAVQFGYCEQHAVNAALLVQTRPLLLNKEDRSRLAPHVRKILESPTLVSQFNQGLAHLDLRWFTGAVERRCLSFVATKPNEGCSTTVAVLAILFAQVDRRVLVIDTACSTRGQAALFGLSSQEISLSRALERPNDCLDLPPAINPLDLRVLGSTGLESEAGLTQTRQFARLLDFASNHFDIVLVDTAPTSERPDAFTIGMRCSGAVTVVRLQHSRSEDTKSLVHGLNASGVEIVGSIGTHF